MEAEAPVCRVCRGEGSAGEPLFFPCRCSGSIKYIHQLCLEEWLAHSNRRYCELCGYEYEFSPLYDPAMPDSMPRRVVLLQVLANVASGFVAAVRSGLVLAMWLLVLPYLVYWLTRFYFWSGHSVAFGPAGADSQAPGALGGVGPTPLPTPAPVDGALAATAPLMQPDFRRFAAFASWYDWYTYSLSNGQIEPIASYTGVIDGATGSAFVVYTVVRTVVKAGVGLLRKVFGLAIADSQLNALVELTMEFTAKCAEGLVITLLSFMVFMAVFMLRDWILTNAPIDEDFVDEADAPLDAGPVADNPAAIQQHNDMPEGALPPLQVEGRPMVPENPQHRPMFAHPPNELPALNDDLPPDERPVPLPPALRAPEAPGAVDIARADATADRPLGTLGDAPGSFQSAIADRQHPAVPDDLGAVDHASPDSLVVESSTSSDSNADSESDQGLEAIGDVDIVDPAGFSSSSDDSVDGSGHGQPARPVLRSSESEDAWSFVGGGSSSAADGPMAARPDSPTAPPAGQRDDALPPTFTGESTRAIYADAGPHSSGASGYDSGADSSSSSDLDREMIDRIRRHHEHAPLLDTGMDIEHEHIQDHGREQGVLWEEPHADDGPEVMPEAMPGAGPDALDRGDVAMEQPGVLGDNGAVFDDDINMGDFEGADGVLEALGFRGPLINATQYFVLVFMVVAMVLAFFAWLPYICGRTFVALAPVHIVIGGTHFLMELIDTASEFVIGMVPLLVWERIRPAVVVLTNAVGPFVVRAMALLVPDTKEALAGGDGGHWGKLTSPSMQQLLLEKLRQSWIIRLLFPWAPAAPTRTWTYSTLPAAAGAGTAPMSDRGFLSRQLAALLARVMCVAGWVSESITGIPPAVVPMAGKHVLSPSLRIPAGERKLWQRLVSWGVPVDRVALRLSEAAAGSTLDDRLLMIAIGHLLGVVSAWMVVTYMPPRLRNNALYGSARMFLRMAKIMYFIFIELMTFPVICGYCLDVSVIPLLPAAASTALASRHAALVERRWVSLFAHWVLGMLFMVHFTRFVLHCRQVMRPGLLWFIRDPNDPEFHPMREILEDQMLPQHYNIARSALMYCGVILACVGLSTAAAVKAAPTMFPIRWAPSVRFSDYPNSIVVMAFLLPVAMMWGRPNELLHFLFSHLWRLVARVARLSEFILGERCILDEGVWMLERFPWLPLPLAGFWMPTRVVQDVFDAFNVATFDRARTGPLAGALPTGEYATRLQEVIDQALAVEHPHVRFVLCGGNCRVPAIDTVPVVQGRTMLVPVDDNGDPVDDQYDYEAADHPELRSAGESQGRALPAPAPENSYRDRRFRREHYGVVYVPPGLHVRMCVVLVFGWLAIAAVTGTTLVLSLAIGRGACSQLGTMPAHDMYALAIGLLVLLVAAVMTFRTVMYLSDMLGQGRDRAAALLDLQRRAGQAWTAAWKLAVTGSVFFGAIPAVIGLVIEVYFVLPASDWLGVQGAAKATTRTPLQAMAQNWSAGVMHVCIGVSVLRFFPVLAWSRLLDRLYTGPPHTWHALRGVVGLALPFAIISLTAVAMPFVVAAAAMWATGSLTADAAVRMFMLEDPRVLVPCVKLVLCTALAVVVARQARAVYRRWSQAVRDRAYLVGQQLHNIGEADAGARDEQPA